MSSFAIPQEPRKASIEGAVMDAATGMPIPNARVILTRAEEAAPGPPQPSLPGTTTDWQGKYALAGLEPGAYRVAVAAEGYARQEYGQSVLGRWQGQGTILSLAAGQVLKDVRVRLTPTGTVTGHIRNSTGQPAAGVQVLLVSPVYGPGGDLRLRSAGAGRTNDRGEYRVYWVTPGKYYVVSGSLDLFGSFQSIETGGLGGSPNEYQAGRYGVTFHPGVSDPSEAVFVTVQSGIELKLDLAVPQQLYRIRGRVVDTKTGRWPASAQVTLSGRRLIEGAAGILLRAVPVYNASDGTFEVRDVPSGLYYVNVNLQEGRSRAGSSRPLPLVVSTSDVNDVLLAVEPYVSIPGKVTIDGTELSALELSRVHVFLNLSAGGRRLTDTSYGAIGGVPLLNPDGTFTLNNVMAGEYRLTVLPLPNNYYTKEARYDGIDVLEDPLLVSSSAPGILTIVLSSKGGRITGTVVDAKRMPARGVQAVLVPDEHRDRSELYRTAIADDAGRITLTGIAPGNYKLFAWEALEQYAYYDPKVVESFAQQGTPVHVTETTTANVQVRMIPAQ
ncbi:MAG TPA: carboxypeptidase-like regulatory domain-containing protein [Terriglobia bacterium]|nr:carboxypeptidase-like regulatory domain-containing protein [Terriglobia bacterium]